ncbi:response regulator containing CheY-like receiver domain and AraC-type DNA-binding domain [Sphaerochaeta pleomorpha str. Grapes]|uniref:Response regulator containing CheY-like receiver domain and AraC-type DNA-binding domain n=1 Tax=Sphaerochaeta pleomorpha (strain ATCC BAA-1885 / DSM 22778 / Grapes) TaxID=158190 RepID=G8QVK4_SPHPG|nr:response regulator [Sphaerochaeta pleomorpha]AEV28237.1 response regulator containing CheY-like receiver domain and AraC-type DNA-binding domain [Sphaerochaeta pleomorpha str. Grapes]
MASMKVMVCDDEEKVCNLICALIDWDRLGLILCGTAFDGLSALSLIAEQKPDLVITDIRMPGLDGLQLIRQAKELRENLEFIIISGHRQFDYAQTAIKYGVADYLLKPIKKQDLEQTLEKMIARHQLEENQQKVSSLLLQEVEQGKEQKRQQAMHELLQKNDPFPLSACFTFSQQNRVFAIKIDYSLSQDAGPILRDKVEEFACREGLSIFTDMLVTLLDNTIYLLISYPKAIEDSVMNKTTYLLSFLKTQAEIFQGIAFTIGVGLAFPFYKEVPLSLLSAKQALSRRLQEGTMDRYVATMVEPVIEMVETEPFFSSIEIAYAQGSLEKLQDSCTALLVGLSQGNLSPYAYEQTLLACYERQCLFIRQQKNLEVTAQNEIEKGFFLLKNARSMQALDKAFCISTENLFTFFEEQNQATIAKPIRLAQQIIAREFANEMLSLESISDQVNLNSSYFSALFKKNCSIGFAEYLQDIRIKNAKKLLAESNLTIAEIAQKVGYRDPKHFAKVFKKACKIKPIEFRKLYG